MQLSALSQKEILHILHGRDISYGASQTFYSLPWRRLSGCGPTTVSNIMAYQAVTQPALRALYPYEEVDNPSMTRFMGTVWRYVTPTVHGVSTLSQLATGGLTFAQSRGVAMVSHLWDVSPSHRPDRESTAQWVGDNLSANRPVAFLCLDPGEETRLKKWHWVLIVESVYQEGRLRVLIYDEGESNVVDLGRWMESTEKPGGLVSFSPVSTG